jgi:hypothetical protein
MKWWILFGFVSSVACASSDRMKVFRGACPVCWCAGLSAFDPAYIHLMIQEHI